MCLDTKSAGTRFGSDALTSAKSPTPEPEEALLLGFRHSTFNVGHGSALAVCDGIQRKPLQKNFLPDPTNYVTARPIEEIEKEMIQTQSLLSQLMEGQINGRAF